MDYFTIIWASQVKISYATFSFMDNFFFFLQFSAYDLVAILQNQICKGHV